MSSGGGGLRPSLVARDAWGHVRRTPVISGVAVLSIALALLLAGAFGFVRGNTSEILERIERDLSVRIYLSHTVEDAAIEDMMKRVASHELVETVTFRTAADEKARIVRLLSEDLLTGVDDEAIPAQRTIEVTFSRGDLDEARFARMTQWVTEQAGDDGVDDIGFDAGHIGVIFAIGDLVSVSGWLLVALSFAAAMFFIALLIRNGLDARDAELRLLSSLGATEAYRFSPYFVAGAVLGLMGALVAVGVAILIDGRLAALGEAAPALNLDLNLAGATLIIGCVVGGGAMGLAGTWFSVNRYLRP